MALLANPCSEQMPARSRPPSPPIDSTTAMMMHQHNHLQSRKDSPFQVSLSPLRIRSQKGQNRSCTLEKEMDTDTAASASSSFPPHIPCTQNNTIDHHNQLQLLSQLVDDAMFSTNIDALSNTLESTIEQLSVQHHQQPESVVITDPSSSVPSSFSEGYPIHSTTQHRPVNPALAALLHRISSGSSSSNRSSSGDTAKFDYDTLAGFDFDTTTLLSLFPEPPCEHSGTLDGYEGSCCSSTCSSATSSTIYSSSPLARSSLSSHSSDRDSTNSLLSTISASSATSMSSVSTSCTTVSLSESDDGHDSTDDLHCSPSSPVTRPEGACLQDGSEALSAAATASPKSAKATTDATSKSISRSHLKQGVSSSNSNSGNNNNNSNCKRKRQKLSMKRHWEVPQQACVIPPIFDKRFFEDDKAEIPKSIKAMEEERLRARQEEEEEAKRRRVQKYELAATTGMSDVRDSGEGDSKEMKLIDDDQLRNTEAAAATATAATTAVVPSHLRPLSPSKSSGGSATFLERRPRRLPFPKDHRFGCSTCPVSPTSPLASPKLTSVSHCSATTTTETSLQAAKHVLEQHSQWTTHMDRQQQSNNNNNRVRDHEDSSRRPPSPLYRSPLSRSMTSPCLVSAVAFSSATTAVTSSATNGKPDHWMLIEPPVRTSSIQTPKSVTPSSKDRHRPLPPSIPSWARRFEMDDQYSSSNVNSRSNVHGYHNNNKFGFYDDLDAQFGLSNGDDEVLVRGDEEAARRRRRWRRNTEERHAEWMETIKAGRWGQEDPRGWSNRLQRLKQHFQTVTGRPISPEDDAMTTITTGMTTTRALTVREEEHGHSKSDSEGSNGGRNVGGRIIRMRTAPKGGARHWFATNNRGTRSLRVVKEISKVDLPHLSKLWHPSN